MTVELDRNVTCIALGSFPEFSDFIQRERIGIGDPAAQLRVSYLYR